MWLVLALGWFGGGACVHAWHLRKQRLWLASEEPRFTDCGVVVYAEWQGRTWVAERPSPGHRDYKYTWDWQLLRGPTDTDSENRTYTIRSRWHAYQTEQKLLALPEGE
jgi:hypothetical protein